MSASRGGATASDAPSGALDRTGEQVDVPAQRGAPAGFTPLVPTFSPYTGDAQAAVRLAWRLTLAAFGILVALAVGGPAAWRWYVGAAIEPRPSTVATIDGTVFLRRQGVGDWVMAKPDEQVRPGDVVSTAPNSRAFLQLFDQSTVLLYPGTVARVRRAEQGRFRPEQTAIVLELAQGLARIGVAPPADASGAFFQLRTPHAEIHLTEGSFSADVARGVSQVRVRLGTAIAHTAHGSAAAAAGQRLIIPAGRPPLGNQPARRDLVENALFTEKAGDAPAGWTLRDLSEQEPPGAISLTANPGAVTFLRSGRGHGETVLAQVVDADLWDFEKVTLSATIRVLDHTLSGGGWQGTEYPLMLRVIYRDITGGITIWYHGFYLHNQEGLPVRDARQLPSTDWHRVEFDLLSLVPRPWRIQRVEVVASGWDYTSAVGEVHIWAE
jgi:hypothetical protein